MGVAVLGTLLHASLSLCVCVCVLVQHASSTRPAPGQPLPSTDCAVLCCATCCRGKGLVDVAFLDHDMRVFRSTNGSLSVQVRQDKLPQLLGWPSS